jgi:hypothetical protein
VNWQSPATPQLSECCCTADMHRQAPCAGHKGTMPCSVTDAPAHIPPADTTALLAALATLQPTHICHTTPSRWQMSTVPDVHVLVDAAFPPTDDVSHHYHAHLHHSVSGCRAYQPSSIALQNSTTQPKQPQTINPQPLAHEPGYILSIISSSLPHACWIHHMSCQPCHLS